LPTPNPPQLEIRRFRSYVHVPLRWQFRCLVAEREADGGY
jgi:hypothetical protein